jgi:hypothetical protein
MQFKIKKNMKKNSLTLTTRCQTIDTVLNNVLLLQMKMDDAMREQQKDILEGALV